MSLINMTVEEFLNEVDSNSPAPGGGSVSALASSLGVALSRMVSHLSFGKKKYIALDEKLREEYENYFNQLEEKLKRLEELIDEDTKAFNEIMKAFKLPKETDEEKEIRKEAIEKATLGAIKVPFEVAKKSFESLEVIKEMVPYGNQNAITDIGCGAILMYAGIEGAILNVKINLSGISDEELITNYKKECEKFLTEGLKIKTQIVTEVNQAIE